MDALPLNALNQLFLEARTYNKFLDKPVPKDLLKEIYNIMRFGPTSMNSCPLRIRFIRSKKAKERLNPYLSPGNLDKTMAAPVTAIFAYDLQFYEYLPILHPTKDVRATFENNPTITLTNVFRNSSLQAAYFMLTARALGLACGPMSGFNHEGLDQEFFPEGRYKTNFICNIGYGAPEGFYPARAPRLPFDETCTIL